jgi:hypothetical protein
MGAGILKRAIRLIGILVASIVIATIVIVLVEMAGLSIVATAK